MHKLYFQINLSKFYDSNSGIAFPEFGEVIGFYVFLPSQVFVDPFAKGAGAFSVDHPHGVQMGEKGVVQIFIQLRDCLVHGFSEQIDLRADGQGFAHGDLPF